jgi:hypothetical protein
MYLPNSCHTVQFSKLFCFAPWNPYKISVLDLLGAFGDHRPPVELHISKHPLHLVPGYAIGFYIFPIQYLCAKSNWCLSLVTCWLLSWCWLRRDPHNCSSFGVLKCRSATDVSSFLPICWICVVQSLVFSAMICRLLFVFLFLFICIVCPLVYGFWLPH